MMLKRIVAASIDYWIICIIINVPYIILSHYFIMPENIVYIVMILGGTMFVFKDVFGASIGKLILGLRIINGDDKKPVTFWKRIARNILMLVFPPIDILTVLIRKDHKKLMDKKLNIEIMEKKTRLFD